MMEESQVSRGAGRQGFHTRHKSISKQKHLFLLSSRDEIWACSHDHKKPDWEESDNCDNRISVHLWDFSQSMFGQKDVRHKRSSLVLLTMATHTASTLAALTGAAKPAVF